MSAIEGPAKLVRSNYEYLVETFDVWTYLDALYTEEVISFGDKDKLRNEQRELERARTFFDLLMRKPEEKIRRFFEILRTRKDKQPQIYEKLFPVTCAEHRGVSRTEHVQVQDEFSRVAAISCQSSSSYEEAPSKTRSQLEQLLRSRPDLEHSFMPTLSLDDLRFVGVLTAEEYRKLQDSQITESQRSQMLLHDILPSKGENSVTDFCDIAHAEEKKRLEIVEMSPKEETKVLRSTEYVSRQQSLALIPTGPSSSSRKRKENFVCTGSQKERVTFYFKPNDRKLIKPIEGLIGDMCSQQLGIERGQVRIYYTETTNIDTMIQSWGSQRPRPCFADLDSKLAVLLVYGIECDQVESCRNELEDLMVMHFRKIMENDQFNLDPQECRVLEVINGCTCIVLLFSTHLFISLLCVLGDRAALAEFSGALQNILRGSTKAILRLGGLPPLKLFPVSEDANGSTSLVAKKNDDGRLSVQGGRDAKSVTQEATPSEAVKQAPSVQDSTVEEQSADTCKGVMEVCIQTGSARLPKMKSEVYELNRNMKSTSAMLPRVHRLKRQIERCYDEIDSVDNAVGFQQIQLEVARADLNQHKHMVFRRAEALRKACECNLCLILSHVNDSLVASYVRANYKTMETSLCVEEASMQLTEALQSAKNSEHKLEKLYRGCHGLLEGLSRRTDVLMVIRKEKICEQSESAGKSHKMDDSFPESDSEKGYTALHSAVKAMRRTDIKALISKEETDLNSSDHDGKTALMIATEIDDSTSAQMLVEASADITLKDKLGRTALHIAIEKNSFSVAQLLVDNLKKTELNAVDNNGRTALIAAVEKEDIKSLQILLLAGADSTKRDKLGRTALHIAVENKSYSVAELLVEKKADVNAMDDDGRTALMTVVDKEDVTSLQMLLQAGADTTLKDKLGRTALHIAIENKSFSVAQLMVENLKKTDLNAVDNNGRTALIAAVEKEDLKSLQMLLQAGADTTLKDKRGRTALHVALFETKNHSAAEVLMTDKTALDLLDDDNKTPLMIAAEKQDLTSLDMLLHAGANTALKDKRGHTALHIALFESKNQAAAQALMKDKTALNSVDDNGRTALMTACETKASTALQMLLDAGSDTGLRDKGGRTALMMAVEKRDFTSVKMLLEAGARNTLADKSGRTPLHMAAKAGDYRTVQVFLDSNVNVNIQDNDGNTPLHETSRFNFVSVAELLLSNRADLSIKNKDGDTPLHEAASQNRGGVVKVLLANKANPDIKNKFGECPHEKAHGDLRQELLRYWEEYRLAQLLKLGKVSLKIVKGYVVGSSRAGKTTFALAVSGKGDPSNVLDRTAGIDIMEVILRKVGHRLKLYDLAGHDLFHTTHSFFFGGVSALFIYLVDTDKSREEMLSDAMYWLSFIISGRSPGGPPVYLMILGSRGGGEDQTDRQALLDSVTRELVQKFGDRFTFILGDKSLVLDMRQANSEAMKEVKNYLAIAVEKCLERVGDVPLVCHKVQAITLPEMRKAKAGQSSPGIPCGQYTDKSEFYRNVVKVSEDLRDINLYNLLLHILEEWGEIVDADSHVVIDTLWLCHSLLAAVLASKVDPKSFEFQIRMKANADGTVSLNEISRALEDFRQLYGTAAVDPEAGVDILCHMGLAFLTEKQGVYRFPSLIQENKPELVWTKQPPDTERMVYVGIRLQCQSAIEIITPAVMPLLQGQAAKLKDTMEVIMWSGGMIVELVGEPMEPKVEGLVVISDKKRAIKALDIISRAPPHCYRDAKQCLDKLHHMTIRILDRKSPGTRIEKQYLSYQQIANHVDKPVSYSQEEVNLAKKSDGVVKRRLDDQIIIKDSVIDLLAVDDDHIIYKLQSLSKHCSDHWKALGCSLLSYAESKVNDVVATLGPQATTEDKFFLVMETWIRTQWRKATLDLFLDACSKGNSQLSQQVSRHLAVTERSQVTRVWREIVETGYEEPGVDSRDLQSETGVAQKQGHAGDSIVTEAQLYTVAKVARDKWQEVGLALKFQLVELDDYEQREPKLERRLLRMLHDWKAREDDPTIDALVTACTAVGVGGTVKRALGLIRFD